MKREKILIIEDEPDICEVIRYNLEREGYRVITAANGEDGLELARSNSPALVVLDLMLPGIDGLEVCRRVKRDPVTSETRVVILTAKGEESDVVVGLELGADDYVNKPFGAKELLARIRAVLRRGPLTESTEQNNRIEFDGVSIDIERHELVVDGIPQQCTATELRLLHFLGSHPGRVFTREQLVNRVIGQNAVVLERNIDVHIRALRKKLGEHRELVQTVRGVGYRFRDTVRT